jgi:hypothetical protein
MTVATILKPMVPRFILLIVLVVLAFYFTDRIFSVFLAGAATGAALRQLSLVAQAVHATPVIFEVIDWDKVDQLLEADKAEQLIASP